MQAARQPLTPRRRPLAAAEVFPARSAPADWPAFGVGAPIERLPSPPLSSAVAATSGIVAATAGVGAFAALAVPSVEKVKTAYTNLTGAQSAYHAARSWRSATRPRATGGRRRRRWRNSRSPAGRVREAVTGRAGRRQGHRGAEALLPVDGQGIRAGRLRYSTRAWHLARRCCRTWARSRRQPPRRSAGCSAIGKGAKSKGFEPWRQAVPLPRRRRRIKAIGSRDRHGRELPRQADDDAVRQGRRARRSPSPFERDPRRARGPVRSSPHTPRCDRGRYLGRDQEP